LPETIEGICMVVTGVPLPPNKCRIVKPIIVDCKRKSIGIIVALGLGIAIGPMSL
jgi:hypothetical protein